MLFFKSNSAFTPFRLEQKLKQIQDHVDANVRSIHADYWFMVHTDTEWQSMYAERLQCLLPNAELLATVPLDEALIFPESSSHTTTASIKEFWVIPRLGTISPWSSKATDILQNCSIPGILRIERGIHYRLYRDHEVSESLSLQSLSHCCYDPLIESIVFTQQQLQNLFRQDAPRALQMIPVLEEGRIALEQVNQELGLALDPVEIDYLFTLYQQLQRNPTDVELMMFAQVNSEHCRHKIFNASWDIDGQSYTQSLFSMIRHTYQRHSEQALVAYDDNAAVLRGQVAQRFFSDPKTHHYITTEEETAWVLKVETHNHPTAISPFPGAATGSGGEIRDEAATGRGAYPKAGLCGFTVSHLFIPDWVQPWETGAQKPETIASPLSIMLQAPLGAAAFNNEFGRPNLTGFFRSFAYAIEMDGITMVRGYHKPIMIAGGIGNIRPQHIKKRPLSAGCLLLVLGGPAMAIGLGGGAASSKTSGDNASTLDFASVQRANPEMQRRCQEVINTCWALGEANPILSIHDVGAGGLSNAMPELVAADQYGASLALRQIPNAEPSMSPMEIWCNEAQERFVLALAEEQLEEFKAIAARERCPFAVLGVVTDKPQLQVHDEYFNNNAVDLAMAALFEKMPRKQCRDYTVQSLYPELELASIDLKTAITRVLQLPCVSSKSFLITIGDRSVTGLVARDQMVGPWQVPVADVAVTNTDYHGFRGEAMAMGERPPVALLDAEAAARLAVGEALTNLAAASIGDLTQVSLSANWMAAVAHSGEGANLYAAVKALGLKLCPELGIAIPVGKDSLSMQTTWYEDQPAGQIEPSHSARTAKQVTAPLSLIITAAAAVDDVRRTLTPELQRQSDSLLLFIDLAPGHQRLGGSALAQVYQQLGREAPDLNDVDLFKRFFTAIQKLNREGLLLAYHDRSDGGLLATLCEMMFASHCGLTLHLPNSIAPQDQSTQLQFLFNEELGAVIQISKIAFSKVHQCLCEYGLDSVTFPLATLNDTDELLITASPLLREETPMTIDTNVDESWILFRESRIQLQRQWSETSYRLQMLRDYPHCAQQEFDALLDGNDPGLHANLTFDLNKVQEIDAAYLNLKTRPKVAILREQGINGYREMAAAFDRAGFCAVDVHMSDILNGQTQLSAFHGLAAGGGFSYGDVLGAGRGWAQSILQHDDLRQQFTDFFNRTNTFTLGACNGCQMLAHLKSLIPGAEHWPTFHPNLSEQFEARLCLVRIEQSPSIFFQGMSGSILPVVVAHGEGRAVFQQSLQENHEILQHRLITLRYVDHYERVTESYPSNPNGSLGGIAGVTNLDGRVMIVMPHPERVFRTVQHSWYPRDWPELSPWSKIFQNVRDWLN